MPATHAFPDQESIYQANQLIIRENAKKIRDRATIKAWQLTESGTGVFYQILATDQTKKDQLIKPGDWISLTYRLTFLDDTECYSSQSMGPKQFVVEKSEAESGLHQVIQLLHPGDSARIVIPPHEAFGRTGDGDRIPPGAILVYTIRIDSVRSGKIH